MRRAILTILGLYNWDNTLFNIMSIPDSVDRDTLVSNILLECSALEIAIPDSDIFKTMLQAWSTSRVGNWDRMATALDLEYEVIHNYDRTETHSEAWTNSTAGTQQQTAGGSDTDTNKVAGFNSEDLVNASENTTAYGGTATNTEDSTDTGERSQTVRAYGNIGVTTSQQMLESEINLRSTYNIYDIIVSEFKKEFCIPIY